MIVKEVMTEGVQAIPETATIQEAARFMKTFAIGAMPATNDGAVTGFLTDRDIVLRGVAAGADPREMTVKEVMTEKPIAIYDNQTIEEAAEAMKGHGIRRLIVISRDGKPYGMLSVEDLAEGDLPPDEMEELLKEVSTPSRDSV